MKLGIVIGVIITLQVVATWRLWNKQQELHALQIVSDLKFQKLTEYVLNQRKIEQSRLSSFEKTGTP